MHLVVSTVERNSDPHFLAFYRNVILVVVGIKLLMFLMASDFILLSTFTQLYSIKFNIFCYCWNIYLSSNNQLMPDIVTASSAVGWLHSNIWGKKNCLCFSPTLKTKRARKPPPKTLYPFTKLQGVMSQMILIFKCSVTLCFSWCPVYTHSLPLPSSLRVSFR